MSCLLTYLLAPYLKVLPEKLTGSQLVRKFPAFYGTRRFITSFTSACHLSLSWARLIKFVPLHSTSWRSILILSSHLRLRHPSGLLPSGFPTETLYAPVLSPVRAICPSRLIRLDLITRIMFGEEYRAWRSFFCSPLHILFTSSVVGPDNLLSTLFSEPSAYVSLSMSATKFHTHRKFIVILCFWNHKLYNDSLGVKDSWFPDDGGRQPKHVAVDLYYYVHCLYMRVFGFMKWIITGCEKRWIVVMTCVHGDEFSAYIKCGEFIEELRNC